MQTLGVWRVEGPAPKDRLAGVELRMSSCLGYYSTSLTQCSDAGSPNVMPGPQLSRPATVLISDVCECFARDSSFAHGVLPESYSPCFINKAGGL